MREQPPKTVSREVHCACDIRELHRTFDDSGQQVHGSLHTRMHGTSRLALGSDQVSDDLVCRERKMPLLNNIDIDEPLSEPHPLSDIVAIRVAKKGRDCTTDDTCGLQVQHHSLTGLSLDRMLRTCGDDRGGRRQAPPIGVDEEGSAIVDGHNLQGGVPVRVCRTELSTEDELSRLD
ncbi:hypothetical protein EB72_18910 [Mycobacterium sp. SWH-M1]|nr:hypothetical protein EB72_18910 [Mycobacterium sp. SWH-M1]